LIENIENPQMEKVEEVFPVKLIERQSVRKRTEIL
jgi:DNA-binding LacI/PurR family transcriptional regulator